MNTQQTIIDVDGTEILTPHTFGLIALRSAESDARQTRENFVRYEPVPRSAVYQVEIYRHWGVDNYAEELYAGSRRQVVEFLNHEISKVDGERFTSVRRCDKPGAEWSSVVDQWDEDWRNPGYAGALTYRVSVRRAVYEPPVRYCEHCHGCWGADDFAERLGFGFLKLGDMTAFGPDGRIWSQEYPCGHWRPAVDGFDAAHAFAWMAKRFADGTEGDGLMAACVHAAGEAERLTLDLNGAKDGRPSAARRKAKKLYRLGWFASRHHKQKLFSEWIEGIVTWATSRPPEEVDFKETIKDMPRFRLIYKEPTVAVWRAARVADQGRQVVFDEAAVVLSDGARLGAFPREFWNRFAYLKQFSSRGTESYDLGPGVSIPVHPTEGLEDPRDIASALVAEVGSLQEEI